MYAFFDPKQAIAECCRVAKKGATFTLTTNLKGQMQPFSDLFRETLIELKLEKNLEKFVQSE